jgi:hypothetical protein
VIICEKKVFEVGLAPRSVPPVAGTRVPNVSLHEPGEVGL